MEFIITIMFVLGVFAFGVFLFENGTFTNQAAFQRWNAQSVADKIARNINSVYLADNNLVFYDYIYWDASTQSVFVSGKSVQTYYSDYYFYSSPINAEVQWNITDVNGLIYFKKQNNVVVVSYEP